MMAERDPFDHMAPHTIEAWQAEYQALSDANDFALQTLVALRRAYVARNSYANSLRISAIERLQRDIRAGISYAKGEIDEPNPLAKSPEGGA